MKSTVFVGKINVFWIHFATQTAFQGTARHIFPKTPYVLILQLKKKFKKKFQNRTPACVFGRPGTPRYPLKLETAQGLFCGHSVNITS